MAPANKVRAFVHLAVDVAALAKNLIGKLRNFIATNNCKSYAYSGEIAEDPAPVRFSGSLKDLKRYIKSKKLVSIQNPEV